MFNLSINFDWERVLIHHSTGFEIVHIKNSTRCLAQKFSENNKLLKTTNYEFFLEVGETFKQMSDIFNPYSWAKGPCGFRLRWVYRGRIRANRRRNRPVLVWIFRLWLWRWKCKNFRDISLIVKLIKTFDIKMKSQSYRHDMHNIML